MALSRQAQLQVLPFLNPFTLVYILAAFLGGSYLVLNLHTDKSGISYLYLLMLLQVTPFVIAVTRRKFNYLSFVLLNHFITYSYTKYQMVKSYIDIQAVTPETLLAVQELIQCTILLTVTYLTTRVSLFREVQEKQNFQMLSVSRVQFTVCGLYVILLPVSLPVIPAFLLIIHFAFCGANMLLMMCAYSPGNERLTRWFQVLVPMSCLWYFLLTGFLSVFGQYAAFRFITICLKRDYKQFIPLIFLAVIVSMMQTVKNDYRYVIREDPDLTTADRLLVLGELLVIKYLTDAPLLENEEAEDETEATSTTIIEGFQRVGDDSIELVMQKTPREVPFWNGETYASIPYMFIPRALWPDKPSRHFWNKYGRVYGVLSEDDYQTSVGVGYLAEAYMNFGFFGMYICSIFFGFFMAMLEKISILFLRGHFYFTYIVFLAPIVSFANDMGSILNSVVVLLCALTVARSVFLKMARKDDYS